jgi:hypothetical protein
VAVVASGCGARSALEAAPEDDETIAEAPPFGVPRFSCELTQDARPMLAARVNDGLFFAYPDRTVREVFTFGVPADGYVSGDAQVIARGDLVAAYVVVAPLGNESSLEPYAELVVVDVEGEVRFFERFSFDYDGWGSDSSLFGNPDGLFVLSLLEVMTGLGQVIDGAEATSFTQKMGGRADPDALGHMLVVDYEASSTAAYHFLDTNDGTVSPSRYWLSSEAGVSASSPAVVDGGIVYVQRSPDRLVFEDAHGVEELELDFELAADDYPSPGWARSGGWALFLLGGGTPSDARYLAAHFASGQTRTFTLSPPDPWQLPEDTWNAPAIDSFGRVVVVLSDGARFQVHATVDGSSWETLGRPLTAAGYSAVLVEAGGAIVFDGYGGGDGPVEGALPSHAAQLVGPQGGEGVELVRDDVEGGPDNPTYGDDVLSQDGRCLSYFKNGSLHVVETATYALSDLGLVSTTQSAESAWIPLASGT